MVSEVTSLNEEDNDEEIVDCYDKSEDEECPEETSESESATRGSRGNENRKSGRKSNWLEEVTNDIVDIICEDEYLRKKIIFINIANAKNQEIYGKY